MKSHKHFGRVGMRRIRQDTKGVSNIIVVALGLVIVVAIVVNIVLWNYDMNQLDWEKMKEDITIQSVTSINSSLWSSSPSGYTLGGSTSWLSGGVSNLTSDDGVYMAFRSYTSGTDTLDSVDNNTSNIDASADKGTHSNFTAQQYGPDLINDTLTEQNTGAISNTTLLSDGFEAADWDANWDDIPHSWQEDNTVVNNGSASAWATQGTEGYFTCDVVDASDANAIYIDFWFRKNGIESTDFTLYYYDGSTYDLVDELDNNGDDNTWLHYTEKVIDSQYFISNFRIRFDATLGGGEDIWVDDVSIKKETQPTANYELDLEVQWTSVDFDESNEELCIYGGTMGAENITVDVWDGGTWQNLFTDLTNGWNNVSVSSYLTSSTFTIRFRGGTETGDTTQDTWNIDVTMLHVWSDEYTAEVEFTGSSNTESWNQLNWTFNSAWTIGSVDVTIQLYDYSLDGYPTSGNGYSTYTSDTTPNTDENKTQTISTSPTNYRNATGYWKMKIKGIKATTTQFECKIDLIELRVAKYSGIRFIFGNEGSPTVHLVSLWINNSTNHQRYDIDIFINSADTETYVRNDINLPNKPYTVKVATERGNIAVYSKS